MAHELATKTNGETALAFVGKKPWHGIGQELTPNQPIEVWRKESGLDYDVLRAPVLFNTPELAQFKGRDVLYRGDTGHPLSVVSQGYKLVQPSQILDFFAILSDIGGFELETAGVLSGGKRIWALAKVGHGDNIIGHDEVRPYILFATSFDGTMATTAKFTAIRVVCSNTITMAVGRGFNQAGKSEADTENLEVNSMVRIPHSQNVDVDDVRKRLGIVSDIYERWLIQTRLLAEKAMSNENAAQFTKELLGTKSDKPVEETKAYRQIMNLFNGNIIGADLAGDHNRWTYLNAITQYVDHERGKSDDTRLSGAWFGTGESLKNKAYDLLLEDLDA